VLRALRSILTVKNAIKQSKLGTLAYKIKCKWGNEAKKKELRLRGKGYPDCT
jgi:hypothetical protein